jgi:hypothetical protein
MQKKLMLPATSFLQTLGSIQDSPGSDPAKMAQDVLFRARSLTENPIDCRIFFADNTRRKTESGIGGKNP